MLFSDPAGNRYHGMTDWYMTVLLEYLNLGPFVMITCIKIALWMHG